MGDQQDQAAKIVEQLEGADTSDPDILDRVLELYFLSDGKRTPEDTESFGVLLERIAYGASAEKRAEIASRLALAEDPPSRLMRRMAFDSIIVARPVLQYSKCLSESDLVTLATKLSQDYLLAIAHRTRLTPPVTDVLVERGESHVLVSVTQNSSASFSGVALERLSELAYDDAELRFALGLRPELSPGLFERFKTFVTDQLLVATGEEMVPKTPPPAKSGGSAGEPSPPKTDPAAEGPKPAAEKDPAQVFDPVRDSYASEKNLVKLAAGGMLNETIACMAKLTELDHAMVEHCLLRAELSALMVLCKANGFGNTTFTVLLKLRQSQSEGSNVIDLKAMLYRYEAMQTHTAKRIIQYANKKKASPAA